MGNDIGLGIDCLIMAENMCIPFIHCKTIKVTLIMVS